MWYTLQLYTAFPCVICIASPHASRRKRGQEEAPTITGIHHCEQGTILWVALTVPLKRTYVQHVSWFIPFFAVNPSKRPDIKDEQDGTLLDNFTGKAMPANPNPNHVPSVCTIWTATRQSWNRSFSKAELEEAALAVSPAKATICKTSWRETSSREK